LGGLVELAIKPVTSTGSKLLEVCSLTPSTSFTLTNSHGNVRERHIIYQCLALHPQLNSHEADLSRLFQSNIRPETWQREANWFNNSRQVDKDIKEAFWRRLMLPARLHQELLRWLSLNNPSWIEVLNALVRLGIDDTPSFSLYRLRADIRTELAHCCAQHLHADLFILDEFQRFKMLLDGQSDTEDALIAHEIFSRSDQNK
jgi:hypothetical protein